MKNFLFPILILFSSFAIGQNDEVQPPVIGIKVPLGNAINLRGVSIKFLEVVEDSRCPKDVTCIWAGRAIVKVEITANGTKSEKNVIIGAVRPGENDSKTLYASKDFLIKGLTLNPYPMVANSGEGTNYVLVVSEEKNK